MKIINTHSTTVEFEVYERNRDIKNQRLYKITGKGIKELDYPPLKFTGSINIDYLKKFADDMQRVAASLKMGTVTPSTLISKLQAYPKQDNLMLVIPHVYLTSLWATC